MIVGFGVDLPEIVFGLKRIALGLTEILGRQQTGEDGVIHVIISEHTVPPNTLEVSHRSEVVFEFAKVTGIAGFMDRIGLGAANHKGILNPGKTLP